MEQEKRGRGRPKIDTHITEYGAPSRRQAINAMYMFEGVHLLSVAATEIPDESTRPLQRRRLRLHCQPCYCRLEERKDFQRNRKGNPKREDSKQESRSRPRQRMAAQASR